MYMYCLFVEIILVLCTFLHIHMYFFNNKMLAKLCGGRHKPNKQTLLPQCAVPELFNTVRIQKV